MEFWRLQTIDFLNLQPLLNDLQVTLMQLDIIKRLINMLLMPQVPTVSQRKDLKVLFMILAVLFLGVSS